MKQAIFLALIVLVGLLIFSLTGEKTAQNPYDFSLRSEFGEHTSLKDFEGKKLIVYFGYTSCPDVCPVTLALLAKELNKIESQNVFLLFISLDIERDRNLKELNEWLSYFYPHSTVLIAEDKGQLDAITKNYGVIYQRINLNNSAMRYSIAHSNELYLIDEKGKFYKSINNLNPTELAKELKEFLL